MTNPTPPISNTMTPSNYTIGSVRRNTVTGWAALRTASPTNDGTIEWWISTLDYGGHYARWGHVNTNDWVDVRIGPPTLYASLDLSGSGMLEYNNVKVSPQRDLMLSSTGTLIIEVSVG